MTYAVRKETATGDSEVIDTFEHKQRAKDVAIGVSQANGVTGSVYPVMTDGGEGDDENDNNDDDVENESPDITTIQVTESQREQLASMKEGNETYRSLIDRIIGVYEDEYESGDVDESRVREITRDEINNRVTSEALE